MDSGRGSEETALVFEDLFAAEGNVSKINLDLSILEDGCGARTVAEMIEITCAVLGLDEVGVGTDVFQVVIDAGRPGYLPDIRTQITDGAAPD